MLFKTRVKTKSRSWDNRCLLSRRWQTW